MRNILFTKTYAIAASLLFLFSVTVASAQTSFTSEWFTSLATAIGDVVGILLPIFIALAFLVFVWGLITFILASGDEAAKDEGKRRMIWGVLALFIITAIWGILALLREFTGASSNEQQIPNWASQTQQIN